MSSFEDDHHEVEDFPPLEFANEDGLLAIGGDLSPGRLIKAYQSGIFPWFNPGDPILWWSPDPRCVLYPDQHRISRSTRKTIRSRGYVFSFDHAFDQVIHRCAGERRHQPGTWISEEMEIAYSTLHGMGVAHSVETWRDGLLVGGLYGIALGGCFFGESMFSHERDASKAALGYLVCHIKNWQFKLIDCQVTSDHLLTLGAEEVDRSVFKRHLDHALALEGRPGSWYGEGAL